MDLTEAKDFKKRWQEYTEELYKKELHNPDNHMVWSWCDHSPRARHPGMWSQGAWGSTTMNKAGGGDGIPVELFQILKDDAVKVLHSICKHIWKTQQCPQDWKRWVFILIPKKGNAKEGSNYRTIALISHASKVMLKILQARLQQYVNWELPDVQAGFRKGRGTRDQIANIHWKSKRVPEKHLFLLCWLHQSPWLCGLQQTGKFFKRWEYQTTWPASWESCMQIKKQQLELDMEQTGSK